MVPGMTEDYGWGIFVTELGSPCCKPKWVTRCMEQFGLPAIRQIGVIPRHQPEGRLALPHLARLVVAAAVAEALATRVQDQAANAAESLSHQEHDLGLRAVGLHQTGGVHLAANSA